MRFFKMIREKRCKFFTKVSALVEGGYDGTLGSKKHTSSIKSKYLK